MTADHSSNEHESQWRENSQFPSIDVVIPTLNCAPVLEKCLGQLRGQDYRGIIRVLVVDGGSTDSTREVARRFGAEIYLNPGQYATGINGARRFGERLCQGDLVWLLDSDNILCDVSAATRLVAPLAEDPHLVMAIPQIKVERGAGGINTVAAMIAREELEQMARNWTPHGRSVRVGEVTVGVPNATLMRRSALEIVGGYDSDVRLLSRLRSQQLASGALVPEVEYVHTLADGLMAFARKVSRRIQRFGSMNEMQLRAYYVEPFPTGTNRDYILDQYAGQLLRLPFLCLRKWVRSRDRMWLWGVALWGVYVFSVLLRPIAAGRVYLQAPSSSTEHIGSKNR